MLDKPLSARAVARVTVETAGGARLALEEVKVRNPHTLLAALPSCLFARSSLVSLHLELDGESRGFRQLKCESRGHELDSLLQTALDPMEFLCQSLAISPPCRDQVTSKCLMKKMFFLGKIQKIFTSEKKYLIINRNIFS